MKQLRHRDAENRVYPAPTPEPHVSDLISSAPPTARLRTHVTMSIPNFWAQPFRYMRYASHEYPARFYSVAIGAFGLALPLVIPIRHKLGFEDSPPVPMTWPSTSPVNVLV